MMAVILKYCKKLGAEKPNIILRSTQTEKNSAPLVQKDLIIIVPTKSSVSVIQSA